MSTMTATHTLRPVTAATRPGARPASAGQVRLTRRGRLVVFVLALLVVLGLGLYWAAGSVATEKPGTPEPTRVVMVGTGDDPVGHRRRPRRRRRRPRHGRPHRAAQRPRLRHGRGRPAPARPPGRVTDTHHETPASRLDPGWRAGKTRGGAWWPRPSRRVSAASRGPIDPPSSPHGRLLGHPAGAQARHRRHPRRLPRRRPGRRWISATSAPPTSYAACRAPPT